jgi:hypothetical protein
MSSIKTESGIERACVAIAKEQNCILLKISGVKGWPDRLLLTPHGTVVWIEFKRSDGGTLADLQHWRLKMLERMQFTIHVCTSTKQFRSILNEAMATA